MRDRLLLPLLLWAKLMKRSMHNGGELNKILNIAIRTSGFSRHLYQNKACENIISECSLYDTF